MHISWKLKTIAQLVKNDNIIADIGTDHGLLPIYMLKNNLCKFAYATDINSKSLDCAIRNFKKYGVEINFKMVQSDGFEKLQKQKIDVAIITGLGTKKILEILSQKNPNISRFILCASDNSMPLRKWVADNNYFIENEKIIYENKIFYEIIVVNLKEGVSVNNKYDQYFGPILIKERNIYFIGKYREQMDYYIKLINKIPPNDKNKAKIAQKMKMIFKVIYDYIDISEMNI